MLNIFKKQIVKKEEELKKTNSPRTLIFIGRSGCGKGTQADLMMNYLRKNSDKSCRTLHIESGSLLRDFAKGNNYTQKRIRFVMDNGLLVPESVVAALWTDYIIANFTGKENLVFDGTPRKLHEAQLLDNAFKFYEIEKPAIIYMNVSEEWSEKRLQERARKDDTPEAIEKRLAWFNTEVVKTLDFYRSSSYYNFIDINGEQSINDVQKEILAKLGLNL